MLCTDAIFFQMFLILLGSKRGKLQDWRPRSPSPLLHSPHSSGQTSSKASLNSGRGRSWWDQPSGWQRSCLQEWGEFEAISFFAVHCEHLLHSSCVPRTLLSIRRAGSQTHNGSTIMQQTGQRRDRNVSKTVMHSNTIPEQQMLGQETRDTLRASWGGLTQSSREGDFSESEVPHLEQEDQVAVPRGNIYVLCLFLNLLPPSLCPLPLFQGITGRMTGPFPFPW